MPHPFPHTTATGLPPVPVNVLLPSPDYHPTARSQAADWFHLDPRIAATVIADYTRHRDAVIDLDRSPTIAAAARWLGRRPTTLVTQRHRRQGRPRPSVSVPRRRRAGLIIVRLPRRGAAYGDLHGLVRAMHIWRAALRPGGFLLAALTAVDPDDHAGTVITAARSAGLRYHQHLIAVHGRLPERDPQPDEPRLGDGRHAVIHTSLLAFAATKTNTGGAGA